MVQSDIRRGEEDWVGMLIVARVRGATVEGGGRRGVQYSKGREGLVCRWPAGRQRRLHATQRNAAAIARQGEALTGGW